MAGKKAAAKKVAGKKAGGTVPPTDVDQAINDHAAEGVVLVNTDKVKRAAEILDLVSGKRVAKTTEELDRKERFSNILAEGEMSAKDAGALRFIYEKLGGLVRTEEEQEAAEETAKELQKKNKKRAIQGDNEK